MFKATAPPGVGGLPEYISRELYRLESELRDGQWVSPDLTNGWANLGDPWDRCAFRRDHHGVVYLAGALSGATTGTNSYVTVLTLPEGYRPLKSKIFAGTQGASGQYVRVDVRSTGEVAAYLWNQTWLSLSGISFFSGQ